MNPSENNLSPDMTLLDIVQLYPATEAIFRSRDKQAGECLLCQALFETVEDVARRYGLDLESLMKDLKEAVLPQG